MATVYDVRSAFQSPSLNEWITRDTAHLVPKLADAELKHALKAGLVIALDVAPDDRAQAVAAGALPAAPHVGKGGK